MDLVKVGTTISYALRHKPEEFNLEPDNLGFVEIDDLINGLYNKEGIKITLEDIKTIMKKSDKKRYEIVGSKIRAVYGHSAVHIDKQAVEPPAYLYHGTTHKAKDLILKEGLKHMERQFVHLSEEFDTAVAVGKRRESNPVIFKVHAKEAYNDGIKFYNGNDTTWTSDDIPSKYLEVSKRLTKEEIAVRELQFIEPQIHELEDTINFMKHRKYTAGLSALELRLYNLKDKRDHLKKDLNRKELKK